MQSFYYKVGPVETNMPWTSPVSQEKINEWWNDFKQLDLEDYTVYLGGKYAIDPLNTDDIDTDKITKDWQQRLLLQFPLMGDETYKMIPILVKNCYSTNNYEEGTNAFLKALLGRKSGYYDFFNDGKFDFVEDIKIEEPPFVVPGQKRVLISKMNPKIIDYSDILLCDRALVTRLDKPNKDENYLLNEDEFRQCNFHQQHKPQILLGFLLQYHFY